VHHDEHQNLLCVVRGRKRVLLLPPSAALSSALQARSCTADDANHCDVSADAAPLRALLAALSPAQRMLVRVADVKGGEMLQ
jgi:hypothetical protein